MQFIKTHKTPLLLGALSVLFYWVFAYDLLRSDFIKLISLTIALFIACYALITRFGWNFWLLAGMGIVFRLVFLPALPNLSQDFYRFIWDGRLVLQGINPFLFTPENVMSSTELASVIHMPEAEVLVAGMGSLNASHFSNYPPLNQLCFGIAALFAGKSTLGSVMVLRILIIMADVGVLYFGKKLLEGLKFPVKNIFWYFLNPFIILELTGNLHFEGVMLFFVVASLYLLHKRKWFWAAVLFGISISIKLLPLLLLPIFFTFFVKRNTLGSGIWKLTRFYAVTLVTVFFSFLPFLSSEFLNNFSATILLWFQTFEFNASVYYIIRWIGFQTIGWNIIADVGKILPLVVLFVILLLAFFRRNTRTKELITGMLFAVSVYLLLSTTVHPWYVATPLLLSVFTQYRFVVLWSFLVLLSYSAYGKEGFQEQLWLVAIEYVLAIGFLIWELFFRRRNTIPTRLQKSISDPQSI